MLLSGRAIFCAAEIGGGGILIRLTLLSITTPSTLSSCRPLKMSSPTSPKSNHPAGISPLAPAGILERAGIKVCIVGTAVLMHFGSDLVLADLDLAVADEQFDSALSLLHSCGFQDIGAGSWREAVMPVLGKPGGWDSRRLLYPPSSDIVALTPASYWHLNINPDTTFLLETDPYRFPHFLVYLEGNLESRSLLNIVVTDMGRVPAHSSH